MMFCQDVLGNRGVIALWVSKRQWLSHKLARNFMKPILFIYDHSVMMYVKCHEDDIRCREDIALSMPIYQ